MKTRSEKFRNEYRNDTIRLRNWDYGCNAAYFLTICTKDRVNYFGEISNGIMKLSEIGRMAEKYWFIIPEHFPFVKLVAFVVMPDHVHGIIIIDKPDDGPTNNQNREINLAPIPKSGIHCMGL